MEQLVFSLLLKTFLEWAKFLKASLFDQDDFQLIASPAPRVPSSFSLIDSSVDILVTEGENLMKISGLGHPFDPPLLSKRR